MVCGAALRVRAAAGLPDCARMVCRRDAGWSFPTDHSTLSVRVVAIEAMAMSGARGMRRTDLAMSQEHLRETLERGYCGRLATVSADGSPYCVPLLYVWADDQVFLHTARAHGHLHANLEHERRVCFVVDEPGAVFPYGRFECDTTIAYRSVTLFGSIALVDDETAKRQFFTRLMEKYAKPDWNRPRDFLPRSDQINVYAIAPQRMTGKEITLPPLTRRWPASDRTKTPNARIDNAGKS
jgi:uncharacterized protein